MPELGAIFTGEREQKCSLSFINRNAPNLRAVMLNLNRFYTYAYLRENGSPYYIGKGQTNRLYYKTKIGDVKPPKDKSKIIFLKQNLTEEEAFKHEIYMISIFGRKDLGTGILHNKTNGGDGVSGKIWTIEEKKVKSQLYQGSNNPFYNKTHTTEFKIKLKNLRLKYEYTILSPNNNLYKIKNLKEFCIQNNLCYYNMNKLANKKYNNNYKGWTIVDRVPLEQLSTTPC